DRALVVERVVLDIIGLEPGAASAGSSIVATVEEVRRAMSELGARESALEVRVELPADVLFDHDRAEIRPDAAAALGHLATLIRAHSGATCRLEGHTDSAGGDAYNQRLSERRAAAVERWLVEREGIEAGRLAPRGWGEARPVASNDTAEGRQRNRRVEAVIEKTRSGAGG
ncbi:MAG TPA: OmpA family protein, partial [Thermoanaerobaculia bacterium]